MPRLLDSPGYVRLWAASTVSSFGSYVTGLAIQVLAAVTLEASAAQLGLLDAARWVPYLLFGLIAGVLVDRYPRKPVLVGMDLGRTVLICAIPLLYLAHRLTMTTLIGFMLFFGAMSLLFEAANQSFLPRLVPESALIVAYARLVQSNSVAQSAGPALAGVLIKAVSAPMAMFFDAGSYLISGLLTASIRVEESVAPTHRRDLAGELREGLAWVYRHPCLSSMALTSHLRFFFNSMLTTVYVVEVLRVLHLGAFGLGVSYACGGLGAVLGSALAQRVGRRLQIGRTLIMTRAVVPAIWVLMPLASPGPWGWIIAITVQFGAWIAIGIEGPTEMGYRQSITPDRLRGRMNATIRSLNWGMVAIGAPIGGLVADSAGYRAAFWIGIIGLAAAALLLALSPFQNARMAEAAESP